MKLKNQSDAFCDPTKTQTSLSAAKTHYQRSSHSDPNFRQTSAAFQRDIGGAGLGWTAEANSRLDTTDGRTKEGVKIIDAIKTQTLFNP